MIGSFLEKSIQIPERFVRGPASAFDFAGSLGCHRFSFSVMREPQFRICFPRRIDLRWALLLPKSLGHPPNVERALRRYRCRHVVSERGRCAAFALGSSRREGTGLAWYVITIQSDLAGVNSAAIRDYIRGWRKLLFGIIVQDAIRAGAARIALPPAADIIQASIWPKRQVPLTAPTSWEVLYDKTALEFGLGLTPCDVPVNIQVLPRRRAHMCGEVFEASLKGGSHEGD